MGARYTYMVPGFLLFIGGGMFACFMMAVGGIALSAYTILRFSFSANGETAVEPNMRTIGLQLMNTTEQGYALPFEVISILLLAALVGTIFIARKSNV